MITVLVALISVGGTLLGVWLTQKHQSKQRESEERRWYADHFLTRKLDTLQNLYGALVDCDATVTFYGNYPPSTFQEYRDQVQYKKVAYERAIAMASLYLDDEAKNTMYEAMGEFRKATMAIWLNLPEGECPVNKNSYQPKRRNIDWEKLKKAVENAEACLRDMLNPKVLKHIKEIE